MKDFYTYEKVYEYEGVEYKYWLLAMWAIFKDEIYDWCSDWWFWHRNKSFSYYIWCIRNYIMIYWYSYKSNRIKIK